MRSQLLGQTPANIYVLVFETGDSVIDGLLAFAKKQDIRSGFFYGVGACHHVTLGFFDHKRKEYLRTPVEEQVEVMSLAGNITLFEDAPKIHAHIVIGKQDSTAHGGHLIEAIVSPTLEVFFSTSPEVLHRTRDAETNLPLIELGE
ncbi:MAG: DNA-binding protein [Acidobacteria bacterium]|nr:DNA-binding protein [Acidobacteriota bacterium]